MASREELFVKTARLALLDELAKIAEEQQQKPKSPAWKRVAKTVGVGAAGYTAGHALGMGVDAAARRVFKNRYPNWSPEFKKRVLFPLLGVSTLGMTVAGSIANDKRNRVLRGEDE